MKVCKPLIVPLIACRYVRSDGPYSLKHAGIQIKKALRSRVCTVMAFFYVSLICDNGVTTQNL